MRKRPSLRRGVLVLLAFLGLAPVIAVLAVAACARFGSGDAAPAELAPASSLLHLEAEIDPRGGQEAAVREIFRKLRGTGDPGAALSRLLAQAFREGETGLDYRNDVKPWLGDRVGLFVSGFAAPPRGAPPPGAAPPEAPAPEAAAVIATTNEDAALGAARKALKGAQERSHEGVDYLFDAEDKTAAGTVEGFLVIGSETGFRAAVGASKDGGSLAEGARYRAALDRLGEDERLATLYFDTRRFLDLAASQPQLAGPQGAAVRRLFAGFGAEPGVAALRAEPDAFVIDSSIGSLPSIFASPAFGAATPLLSRLPADSWLAIGQPDLGGVATRFIDTFLDSLAGTPGFDRAAVEQRVRAATGLDIRRDILGWIGDVGIFVRGTSRAEVSGGAVIESKDPAASRRGLAGLARLVRRQGEARVRRASLSAAEEGFEIRDPDASQPVFAVQRGSRVVLAYGEQATTAALEERGGLGDNPGFRGAASRLGAEFGPSNYVAVAPILALAEASGAGANPGYARARPYLERFEHVIAGTRREGGALVARTRIQLRPPGPAMPPGPPR